MEKKRDKDPLAYAARLRRRSASRRARRAGEKSRLFALLARREAERAGIRVFRGVFLGIYILVVFPAFAYAAETDLMLRMVARKVLASPSTTWAKIAVPSEVGPLIPCLVKSSSPSETAAAIEATGGRASLVSASILSAYLSPEEVHAISERGEVWGIEAAVPLNKKMDTARTATAVDTVQDGSALGVAYDGSNVVVGIVDETLDYGHPDFAGSGGTTRIQCLRQISDEGILEECTKRTIADGSCAIEDRGQGYVHGTHVTGIAAGNDGVYRGVANAADIMFSFIDSYSDADTSGTDPYSFATLVLEGVSAIFEKADIIDKPAVVNLSLGTSIGAHDGSSLLEQGLTELTAAKPGRIVVDAAGNEQAVALGHPAARRDYVGGIHASISVPDGEGYGSRLAVWSGNDSVAAYTGGTMVEVWLDAGQKDTCALAVFSYTNGRAASDFTFPGLDTTDNAVIATGDVSFSTDTTTAATASGGGVDVSVEVDAEDLRNSKPHAIVLITPQARRSGSVLEDAWFDVVVRARGGECTGHMWIYYDYTPIHDFLKNVAGLSHDVGGGSNGAGYKLADGDSLYTTTVPATAVGVITVGSWLPEKPAGSGVSQWTPNDGNTYDQTNISSPGGMGSVLLDLSSFSSLGPTADGRTKPDVVAPGEPIIAAKARGSSVSSSRAVGDSHMKLEGTSMAAPHVTGIVALLLQRNNNLTIDEVREALRTGASTVGMVSRTPDAENSYGAGKVDAASVLTSVGVDTSAYHGTGDLESVGSGGCSLLSGKSCGAPPISLLVILITTAVSVVLIRRNLLE